MDRKNKKINYLAAMLAAVLLIAFAVPLGTLAAENGRWQIMGEDGFIPDPIETAPPSSEASDPPSEPSDPIVSEPSEVVTDPTNPPLPTEEPSSEWSNSSENNWNHSSEESNYDPVEPDPTENPNNYAPPVEAAPIETPNRPAATPKPRASMAPRPTQAPTRIRATMKPSGSTSDNGQNESSYIKFATMNTRQNSLARNVFLVGGGLVLVGLIGVVGLVILSIRNRKYAKMPSEGIFEEIEESTRFESEMEGQYFGLGRTGGGYASDDDEDIYDTDEYISSDVYLEDDSEYIENDAENGYYGEENYEEDYEENYEENENDQTVYRDESGYAYIEDEDMDDGVNAEQPYAEEDYAEPYEEAYTEESYAEEAYEEVPAMEETYSEAPYVGEVYTEEPYAEELYMEDYAVDGDYGEAYDEDDMQDLYVETERIGEQLEQLEPKQPKLEKKEVSGDTGDFFLKLTEKLRNDSIDSDE